MYSNSRFIHAEVISTVDPKKTGFFLAKDLKDGSPINVCYTSPFYSVNEGGVFAIPAIHSEIGVLHDIDQNRFFYLFTMINPNLLRTDDPEELTRKEEPLNQNYVYTEKGSPRAMTFGNEKNARLLISNYFEEGHPPHASVQLDTPGKHQVYAGDNPNRDSIELVTRHGDSVILTGNATENRAAQSFSVETELSQKLTTIHGDMTIVVEDGRDLTLRNKSTGAYKGVSSSAEKYGNINLVSELRNINIYTTTEGSVLISTKSGDIQVNSDGEIRIIAKNSIYLQSDQDINMTGQNINITSRQNLNLNSGAVLNATSTGVASIAGSVTNIGATGRPLALNGSPGVAIPAPTAQPVKNVYGY